MIDSGSPSCFVIAWPSWSSQLPRCPIENVSACPITTSCLLCRCVVRATAPCCAGVVQAQARTSGSEAAMWCASAARGSAVGKPQAPLHVALGCTVPTGPMRAAASQAQLPRHLDLASTRGRPEARTHRPTFPKLPRLLFILRTRCRLTFDSDCNNVTGPTHSSDQVGGLNIPAASVPASPQPVLQASVSHTKLFPPPSSPASARQHNDTQNGG